MPPLHSRFHLLAACPQILHKVEARKRMLQRSAQRRYRALRCQRGINEMKARERLEERLDVNWPRFCICRSVLATAFKNRAVFNNRSDVVRYNILNRSWESQETKPMAYAGYLLHVWGLLTARMQATCRTDMGFLPGGCCISLPYGCGLLKFMNPSLCKAAETAV